MVNEMNVGLIPKQLDKCKFLLIRETNDPKKEKVPLEKGWTKENNYDMQGFYNAHSQKFYGRPPQKYGVFCGYKGLIVIDCDEEEYQNACLENPLYLNTFTTKTAGKGLYHFYFYTDKEVAEGLRIDQYVRDDIGEIILNEKGIQQTKRIADVQGFGTQVIGANSKLNSGKVYEIVDSSDIKVVSYQELIDTCKNIIPDLLTVDTRRSKNIRKGIKKVQTSTDFKKRKEDTSEYEDEEIDPVVIYIKSQLTIQDLLEKWGINTRLGKNCECPFHESEAGQCLSHEKHQFNCFHCNKGGSMFDLAMEYYKKNFIETKNLLASMVGVPKKVLTDAHFLITKAKRAEATEFLVSKFMKDNYLYTIRNSKKPEMWIYNNGIYTPHGETYIIQYCRAVLGEFYSTPVANQVIAKIMADTFINEKEFFGVNYPFEVPVRNGILNIKTRDITKFTPEKIFFNKLPMFFDINNKSSEKFSLFLKDTLKYKEDRKCFQEMVGYCLWKECKMKKAFLVVGDGNNAKSVAGDVISAFLGINNVSNVSLQDIDGKQFAVCDVFGKMANIDADIGQTMLSESSMFKKVVAGDEIQADRKFLTTLKFRNYAKCIFCANTIPETVDRSLGFFTRWTIFDFPYTFLSQDKLDQLTQKQKDSGMFKLANKNITEELTTEEELSGILYWALDGFDRIYRKKKFTISPINKDIQGYWNRKESSFKAFFEDSIDITYNNKDFITTSDLNIAYCRYCADHNLKVQTIRKRSKILEEYPTTKTKKRIEVESGDSHFPSLYEFPNVWAGIKLKTQDLKSFK